MAPAARAHFVLLRFSVPRPDGRGYIMSPFGLLWIPACGGCCFNVDSCQKHTGMTIKLRFLRSEGVSWSNQDIGGWNTSGVTDMSNMFYGATVFDQDLSGWCVTSVSDHDGFDAWSPIESQPGKLPIWGSCPLPPQ